MPELILLNKPYGVICQFSQHELHKTLKDFVQVPDFYPAGRLDTDSEGLLLLTNDGTLQHRISDPRWKLPKTYWVQVEGMPSDEQLEQLRHGVDLGDFVTRPAECQRLDVPDIWPRTPPIRSRKTVADSWIALTISEGKNRQVRRMTAKVGLPTLRLVRVAIGPWRLDGLMPGEMRRLQIRLEDLSRVKHAFGINRPAGASRRPTRNGGGGGWRGG